MENNKYLEFIKAEIERQRGFIEGLFIEGDNNFYDGQDDAYNHLLAFIDSLPEEKPSEDLEEEIQGMYQAIFGTDIINRREMVYLETFDMIARHFAEWGRMRFRDTEKSQKEINDEMLPLDVAAEDLEKVAAKYERENRQSILSSVDIVDAFIAGAEWHEQQMIKEAVEGEIVKDISNKLAVTAKNINLDGLKFGDKVKIIIVKQDE